MWVLQLCSSSGLSWLLWVPSISWMCLNNPALVVFSVVTNLARYTMGGYKVACKFKADSCWCTEKNSYNSFIFSHIWWSFNTTIVVLLTEHHLVIAKKSCNCFRWHYECFQVNTAYLKVLCRCVRKLITILSYYFSGFLKMFLVFVGFLNFTFGPDFFSKSQ